MSTSIIDWLSFSFSPEPIRQLKELAKVGVLVAETCVLVDDYLSDVDCLHNPALTPRLRSVPTDVLSSSPLASLKAVSSVTYEPLDFPSMMQYIDSNRVHPDVIKNVTANVFSQMYSRAIGSASVEVNTDKFTDNWLSCLSAVGVQALDNLCASHIDDFLFDLVVYCSKPGNFWSLKLRSAGMFGYSNSAHIICNGAQCGAVAWGAKNHGCYVSLSGTACAALDMSKVYALLSQVNGVRLTRVDVAYDDLLGAHVYDDVESWYCDGLFRSAKGGKMPKWRTVHSGEGQKLPSGRYGMVPTGGRCCYVGNRENGKLFRAYEKGKQLSCAEYPNWIRFEVEFHNKSRDIPIEILIQPNEFLAGSYPALAWVLDYALMPESEPLVIPTRHRAYKSTYLQSIEHAATHTGKMLNFMTNVLQMSPDDVVERLTSHLSEFDIPDHLQTPVYMSCGSDTDDTFRSSISDYLASKLSEFEKARLAYLESLNED